MPRSHLPYTSEFWQQMTDLVRSGRDPRELPREFEPSGQTICDWVAQADRDDGWRTDGMTSAERVDLPQLRREIKRLREGREILSKVAAWFAWEIDAVPPKSTRWSR